MLNLKQITKPVVSTIIASTLLFASALVAAQGNSNANGQGKNKNVGVGNASDGIMGSVITNKRIYYTGDSLDIGLRFARGSELIIGGSVDAYVVVFSPTGNDANEVDPAIDSDSLTDAIVLPVSAEASTDNYKLFAMDTVNVESLPAGTYQLGLILTNPDGDPLNINDWHNGLLGLINIVGLTITDEAVDFDQDGDGQVDDDDDGDGFSDTDDSDPDTTETSP